MKRRVRLTKFQLIALIAVWPVLIAASLTITAWQMRQANLRELKVKLPVWREPSLGEKLVVFAPHPDDEIIGAAGLMRKCLEKRGQVWVVLMTNGDGYPAAAAPGIHMLRTCPADFMRLGYKRQRESFAALDKIGVPRDHILTLCYPDRGLEAMWMSNWCTPLKSSYTQSDHSPYSDAFTPRAPQTGRQAVTDLIKLLVDIDPDTIILPYPSDQHSDHWGTSVLVATALYDLGWWDTKLVGMYLVHRGDWPVPKGLNMKVNLAPPAALMDVSTIWYALPLDRQTEALKRAAVSKFRSQPGMTKSFLESFVRENELFAIRSPEVKLYRVMNGPPDWNAIDPVVRDGVADGMISHAEPASDIVSIHAARNADRIYFRIELAGNADGKTYYELRVRPLVDDDQPTSVVVVKRGRTRMKGWQVSVHDRDVDFARPLGDWLNQPLMVSAGTRISFYQVDRTAYSILMP